MDSLPPELLHAIGAFVPECARFPFVVVCAACYSQRIQWKRRSDVFHFVNSITALQWAREKGCPWNERVCAGAAGGGLLEVLRWARDNGCPWNEWTCSRAAQAGHLHVLQWARKNECPWDEATCVYAAAGGHLQVLQWAHENECPWR